MKKRILACLLSVLLAAGVSACGTETPGGTDTAPTDGTGGTEPSEEGTGSGVPAGMSFGGATVRILNGQYYDQWFYLLSASEANGDILNDAVYNRNLAVEQALDIEFEFTDLSDYYSNQQAKQAVINAHASGDQEWDILQLPQYSSVNHVYNGRTYDMAGNPYSDWEAPWWSTSYIKAMNYGSMDAVHMVSGDISIAHLNQATCLVFNKSILEDYYGDGNMLYGEVISGDWTIERMYELSSEVWSDLNHNSRVDVDDLVGYMAAHNSEQMTHFFVNAGGYTAATDENGKLAISQLTEKNSDIVEAIYRMIWENPGFASASTDGLDIEVNGPTKFAEGNILFMSSWLNHADLLRNMEEDYGILPYPKFDKADGYASLIHNQAVIYMLPHVTSTADMAQAVLEEMAFQGYKTMIPEYYNTALKIKYARDTKEESAMVIDIIRDSVTTDPGYALYLGSIGYAAQECIAGNHTNYASQLAAFLPAAQAELDKRFEYFGIK